MVVKQWAEKRVDTAIDTHRERRQWLRPTSAGLWCEAGSFHVDPHRPVDRAVITHGHADHARPGHGSVLTTPETAAIMRARYGDGAGAIETLAYGTPLRLGDVGRCASCRPAISSAAPRRCSSMAGSRIVVSGDYKRRPDPTCAGFEVVPCDVFITEATFGLPVFRHPPDSREIERLLTSLRAVSRPLPPRRRSTRWASASG